MIACQLFNLNIDGTNTFSQLFHLPRFYSKYKPRAMLAMEKIIDILKLRPDCMAEYHEIRSQFDENFGSMLRRMFKSQLFHKIVINDTVI